MCVCALNRRPFQDIFPLHTGWDRLWIYQNPNFFLQKNEREHKLLPSAGTEDYLIFTRLHLAASFAMCLSSTLNKKQQEVDY